MIVLNNEIKKELIQLAAEKNIFLEGNIAKVIDKGFDKDFSDYIGECISRDKDNRKNTHDDQK